MTIAPFIPDWTTPGYGLRPFTPELILVAAIIAVLLTPFFTPARSNRPTGLVALAGLGLAFLATLWIGAAPESIGLHFRGMLLFDHVAVMWKGLLLLFVIGIVGLWFATTSRQMHEGDGPEFFTLLLGATLGMSLMGSTTNLLLIIMAIELASLPSYVLAGFRKTDRVGAEASLKYVLFGAATAAIMIYGLSLLYGLYGSMQLEVIAERIAQAESASPLLGVAILSLLVGIGFKIATVPLHFWCPDVFEGAGVDVSAFLSVASKGAALVLLLRILMLLADAVSFADAPGLWLTGIAVAIGILGAITATVGNLGALPQTSLKRLLAYSSIAHAGYMLCVLSILIGHGGALTPNIAGAILIYLAVYLFMNLGAFTVAGAVEQQTGDQTLAGFANLGHRAPILAACMTAFMFSLVGLPPFAGFIAKLNIMYVLGSGGGWWWVLVAVIGLNTIISLYYYVRIIRAMYLVPGDDRRFSPVPLAAGISAICAVVLVVMLIAFAPINRLMTHHAQLWSPPVATDVAAVSP
jgi:NADH-quinone oxidoreductase subunit N